MANDPRYIPIFNDVQLRLDADMSALSDFPPIKRPFLAELTPDEGTPMVGALLVGPFHAGDPSSEKVWEYIELKGEGVASVIIWVDQRRVAEGRVTLGRNLKKTNRLKLKRGNRTGQEILALIMLSGRLLQAKCHWSQSRG